MYRQDYRFTAELLCEDTPAELVPEIQEALSGGAVTVAVQTSAGEFVLSVEDAEVREA